MSETSTIKMIYGLKIPTEVGNVLRTDKKFMAYLESQSDRVGVPLGLWGGREQGGYALGALYQAFEVGQPIHVDSEEMNEFTDVEKGRDFVSAFSKIIEKLLTVWTLVCSGLRADIEDSGSGENFEQKYPHLGIPEDLTFQYLISS